MLISIEVYTFHAGSGEWHESRKVSFLTNESESFIFDNVLWKMLVHAMINIFDNVLWNMLVHAMINIFDNVLWNMLVHAMINISDNVLWCLPFGLGNNFNVTISLDTMNKNQTLYDDDNVISCDFQHM